MNLLQMLSGCSVRPIRIYPRPGEQRYREALSGRWRTSKQIANQLGYTIQAVDTTLRRYEKQGLIIRRQTKRIVAGKNVLQWKFK